MKKTNRQEVIGSKFQIPIQYTGMQGIVAFTLKNRNKGSQMGL
jgi:hypothetical protein